MRTTTVLNCVNVRQACNEQVPHSIRILPGNRVPFYRVEPDDRSRPSTYRRTRDLDAPA